MRGNSTCLIKRLRTVIYYCKQEWEDKKLIKKENVKLFLLEIWKDLKSIVSSCGRSGFDQVGRTAFVSSSQINRPVRVALNCNLSLCISKMFFRRVYMLAGALLLESALPGTINQTIESLINQSLSWQCSPFFQSPAESLLKPEQAND